MKRFQLKKMFRKSTFVYLVMTIFCFGFLSSTVLANAPKSVDLTYDQGKQELSVKIVHPSSWSSHYINKVVIKKNGTEVSTNEYTSQPTETEWVYTYAVPAVASDQLEATASCNIFGSKTTQLKVE